MAVTDLTGTSVTLDQVSVRIGGHDILRDISAVIKAGEIHCIVGPNGGGKTTLIRSLLGQMPHRGRIVVGGAAQPVVGYAPQSLDLDRGLPLTVRDVLRIMNQRRPAFFGGTAQTAPLLDAALEEVGLGGKAKTLFGTLSGGERQRLLFAQALVPKPHLLIMDEPTSNLDEAGVRTVERIVRELSRSGVTVIWVNHDWNQVRAIADAVTGINRTVTFSGPPTQWLPQVAPIGVFA